ncbi:phage tail tip lysozyme [Lentilactobacillus senioris]|nr:phage tail tip lysozyme [Lentilactobacillus senioris]
MWNVVADAIGSASGSGGTREAFLKYAEEHYAGKPYVMGGMGPDVYDCSGMVASALAHFGINIGRTTVAMQTSSGVQHLGQNLSNTLPGDIVVFGHGTGAAGHVGIIKNPKTGSMFNETPPRARVTSIASDKSMGYGYYRIKGLHNAVDKKEKNNSSKRLKNLAKKQLGKKAINWIKDNLGEDEIGDVGNMNLVGDMGSRARILAAAIKKMYPSATNSGIAAVLGNWSFESHLDPGAINPGGGASGLGQWLGGRKDNLIKFARKTGGNWKSAATQLEFALKGDSTDSGVLKRILSSHGSVSSLAAAFSNQWERGGYTAQHVAGANSIAKALHANGGWAENGKVNVFGEVPGQNEVAINTSRPSADKLIMEAMSDRASKQPNGVFGQLKEFAKIQNEFRKMKLSRDDFNESVKSSSVGQKAVSIKPNMNYHPEIHIEGTSDPERTGDVVAKRLTEDRRKFEAMANDFFGKILAAQN